MSYEYKVNYIEAIVTDKDVSKGVAWSKLTAQTETKLTEMNELGWEFMRSEVIKVEIQKTGCFGSKSGESLNANVLIFVFRREVK
jgi:hypothetical protein